MKQLTEKNKKIIIAIILSIIIIAGIIVTSVIGFNKELRFKESQGINVYIEQQIDTKKVKDIANEVLQDENIVELVEIYKDMVTIRAEKISDEQKANIINKLKENYEFEQTVEDTPTYTIPKTRIIDMYKKYIMPFIISAVLVLIYITIRYYKKGIAKVLSRTICIPIIGELVLLSVIAITRIPVGRFTPVLVIVMYVITIMYVVRKNEK